MARDGTPVAEIARRLGIRYQHAYGVLRTANPPVAPSIGLVMPVDIPQPKAAAPKPQLSIEELKRAGFELACRWVLSGAGDLELDGALPKDVGVYAFVKGGTAAYVGVATMGIAKRLYSYRKPGITQRTNQRISRILKSELLTISSIEIYVAMPVDLEWNGLPVHGSAGLELGLIKKFMLPWNLRSAR